MQLLGTPVQILTSILLACAGPTAPVPTSPPIELWIYGQSNAVSPANDQIPVFSSTGHVTVNDFYCEWLTGIYGCYQGSRMVLTSPFHTIRSNQAWILLGDMLYRETGRDVVVYQFASGGKTTGQLRQDELFASGKQALRDHPDICAALWIQGEAEVGVPVSETVNNMRSIVTATRAIHPGLKWFVALDAGGRQAQSQLISDGLVKQGPDIDQIRSEHPDYFQPQGHAEFEGAGHRAHANAWLSYVRGVC